MSRHVFRRGADPLSILFPVGTILWRHCTFAASTYRTTPTIINPEWTEKQTWMLRCGITGSFINEPELISPNATYQSRGEERSRPNTGIIVFFKEELPKNWTHLVVHGHSKAMHDPKAEKGQALFCDVGKPIPDYLEMRRFLAKELPLDGDFEEIVTKAMEYWPDGITHHQRRLITDDLWLPREDGHGTSHAGYTYCHIRLKEPEFKPLPDPVEM